MICAVRALKHWVFHGKKVFFYRIPGTHWFEETIEALIETKPEQPNPKLSNEDLANALIDNLLLNALERLQHRKETFEVCKEIDSGLFDKAVEKVETTEMCQTCLTLRYNRSSR